MTTKYLFYTGGVVSSVGKGVTAAATGLLLKERGFKVAVQKLDPYINVDPGTMSPNQHGEVYVLDDGAETDLDLGHYERFIDIRLSKSSNFTSGQVYAEIISKERRGDFLGGTIQVIHPCNVAALHWRQRRDQDQTHTTFGGGIAFDRYFTEHDRCPIRLPNGSRVVRQDRIVL